MSYKNPRIIDDKSGLIVSQAINQATTTLGQGIAAFGVEEKRREEVRKKEQEKRDKIFITLANDMATDSNLFNKSISKASEGLRGVLIPRNEKLLQRINDIRIQQQINNNKDPNLSKELSNLRSQIADGNAAAQTYIGTASLLSADMKDPGAFQRGEKTFRIGPDGSSKESEAIYFATGGSPGYTTTWNPDLSVTVSDGTTQYTNTREEFEAKSTNLYITKKTNMRVEQNKFIRQELYNDEGKILSSVTNGEAVIGDERNDGRIYTYSTQVLNTNQAARIIKTNAEIVGSTIDSFEGDKQAQALRLKDLNLNVDEYQNNTKEGRQEMVMEFAERNFLDGGNVKKEGDTYVIKTQIGNSTKVPGLNALEQYRKDVKNFVQTNWESTKADGTPYNSQERAQAIINSFPFLRTNLNKPNARKLVANKAGNLMYYSGEIDDDATTKWNMDKANFDKGYQPQYSAVEIDITSGTDAQNISTLTKFIQNDDKKIDFMQAEDRARLYLNKTKE
tara:strand:+ start:921 stop:2438 length:1518 start_codon:yes stop_codon:yes gene_type:complete